MARISTAHLTPAEAAHYVLETLLQIVVAALLVTAASAVVVGLARDEVPATLTAGTLVLAVVTALLWNRTVDLGVKLDVARKRAARPEMDEA